MIQKLITKHSTNHHNQLRPWISWINSLSASASSLFTNASRVWKKYVVARQKWVCFQVKTQKNHEELSPENDSCKELTVPRGKVWSLNFLILHSTLTCWHIYSSSLRTLRTPFKHLGLAEKQVLNFIQTRRVIHIAGIKHRLRTRSHVPHVQSFWSQIPRAQQSFSIPRCSCCNSAKAPELGCCSHKGLFGQHLILQRLAIWLDVREPST